MSKARDIASAPIAPSTVSATELGYVDGVTSAIQTQIDSKIGSASAINPTIVDAKGDIIAATAADTVSKLTVGSNDTVLTADSSTATGLKWATPAAGGMTLISTTTFNNTVTNYTLSSIPQTYKHLMLVGSGLQSAAASGDTTYFRFNGDTGANYGFSANCLYNGTVSGDWDTAADKLFATNFNNMGRTADASSRFGNFTLNIYDYTTTTYKAIDYIAGSVNGGTGNAGVARGLWNNTAAITSITFTSYGNQNLKAGIVRLYGVS